MQTSRPGSERVFTRSRRSAERGFTLVELMVTITVVALLSGALVWAVPAPGARVRDDALRFAARVRAARDQAIVSAQPVSVWVTAGGYGFDQRASGRWVPMSEKPLRVERWAEGARAVIDAPDGRARVTYDPTGLPDRGADVRLAMNGRNMLIRLGADGSIRADAQ